MTTPETQRMAYLQGFNAAAQGKWIAIKDRVPPESPFYSIFIVAMFSHYKKKTFVEPLHYIGEEWFTMVHEEPLDAEYEVTHWMPLPEAPTDTIK